MEIKVCVGSACHLKGSYLVIEKIQEYIKKNNLDNKIELKASFCLGKCTSNVSVLINNELLSVKPDDIIKKNMERAGY